MKKVIGWSIIIIVILSFIGLIFYIGGTEAIFGFIFLSIVILLIMSLLIYAIGLINNS